MSEQVALAVPCKLMIYDSDGYHGCSIFTIQLFCKHPEMRKEYFNPVLCAWFYDISNPGFTIEVSIKPKTHKISSISTFDFPDSTEYKEMIERTMTEADVPKLCPLGYTFKQINAKIQPLHEKWQRSKKYQKKTREFQEWLKKQVVF
jgi:hypothetical protein